MDVFWIVFIIVLAVMFLFSLYLFALNSHNDKKIKEGLLKRELLIKKIETNVKVFIENANFFEPIMRWQNKDIYKFIYNKGYLYEFSDLLSEADNKIGVDENMLYFDRICYKRVNNPDLFISKYSENL